MDVERGVEPLRFFLKLLLGSFHYGDRIQSGSGGFAACYSCSGDLEGFFDSVNIALEGENGVQLLLEAAGCVYNSV